MRLHGLACAIALTVLAWPSAGLAQSGTYYVVGLSDQAAWLADRDSIRWSGGNPIVTLHQIYRTPSPVQREYGPGYDLYQRAEYRIEIDCSGHRTRDVGFTMIGFTASARPIRLTDQEAWEPIGDTPMFTDLHALACSNQVPAGTTPANDLQIAIVAYYQVVSDEEE